MKPAKRPVRGSSVFINVPYDEKYEPLFLALIAGLVGLGLTPRATIEVPESPGRLRRILSLIKECPYSIHDLSRVQLSRGSWHVPRFNMPFELGLAVASWATPGSTHQWVLMEEVAHRLQQSLSDANGFDPKIHNGDPNGVLKALLDIFPWKVGDFEVLSDLYKTLRNYRTHELKAYPGKELYRAHPFHKLIVAASSPYA